MRGEYREMEDNDKKEYKDLYKKIIFDEISEISQRQSNVIIGIEGLGKYIGLHNNISNTGIRLNNKLIELEHEFEKSGISMYSVKMARDSSSMEPTFVGIAIISDLLNMTEKGIEHLSYCGDIIPDITTKKLKSLKKIKRNPLRRFLIRMRNFFASGNQSDILYTEEEMNTIKASISKYEDVNNELTGYNLRDNIASSITRKIREQKYEAYMVPELLQDEITPDLQKLGLADLIPEIQSTLVEEYKKDLPDPDIYQISKEDMYLYVPDFNREIKSREEISRMTPEERLNKIIQAILDKKGASLEKKGVTLRDFSSIDEQVNASDRQAITVIIKQEIDSEKQEISEKTGLQGNKRPEDSNVSL